MVEVKAKVWWNLKRMYGGIQTVIMMALKVWAIESVRTAGFKVLVWPN